MSQQFSFPVLADHDLLPCLKEMEIPLSAATLAKPTPELVRPVYETAITTLMGITRWSHILDKPVSGQASACIARTSAWQPFESEHLAIFQNSLCL